MHIPDAFKRYDIRGLYPEEVSEKFAEDIGISAATLPLVKKSIVVGGDNNTSTPFLKSALIKGILSTGADVIDVGTGPTDFIAYAGMIRKSDMSIMITASHLGIKYNGFKFMYGKGNSFSNEDLAKLKEAYLKKSHPTRPSGHLTHDTEALKQYLARAKDIFRRYFKKIDSKIIIDTGDGACSLTTPVLLKDLGATVIKINSDIDGGFRRHSDCSEEKNISYLKDDIKKHNADLAIAHDLDGDRLAVINKNGHIISGNHLFAIFAHIVSKDTPIIASIDTSELLKNTTTSKIIYTRVGDPFVLKALVDSDAILAGEPNGHYALKDFVPYNSATLFALLIAASSKDIDTRIESMPRYDISQKKITTPDPKAAMEKVKQYAKSHCKIISEIDGIKYMDGTTTVLIRQSGTENAMRILAEDTKDSKEKLKIAEKLLVA